MTVTFNGTYLAWIATKGTTLGKAYVSLDGGAPVKREPRGFCASPTNRSVWNTGTLASGTHTVKIWRDPSSLDGQVHQCGRRGGGRALSSRPLSSRPRDRCHSLSADGRASLAYAGSWYTFSRASASSGSYRRANLNTSSVTVTFNGTYLAWIATKGTTLGKAFVSLDNGTPVSVNLAASVVAYQQKVWNTGTLASGTHTVKIWRDPSSPTGKYISVDAIDVTGALLSGTSTRIAGIPSTGTSYYVDPLSGSDSNSGTSPAAPWKTLAKVRATTFAPGSTILLFGGGRFFRTSD